MTKTFAPDEFRFRGIHPLIRMGTASDRYAGWIGQIYSRERFGTRISRRVNRVGGKSFKEEVLPVESVGEYFEHFSVLELDSTFYSLLLDEEMRPTPIFTLLQNYNHFTFSNSLTSPVLSTLSISSRIFTPPSIFAIPRM